MLKYSFASPQVKKKTKLLSPETGCTICKKTFDRQTLEVRKY